MHTLAILLALACGTERWDVKTLMDSPALATQRATISSVAQLVGLPAPRYSNAAPRSAQESQVVGVTAWIVGYKLEADADWHVVIQDAAGQTMIVEFPDPPCSPEEGGPGFAKARGPLLALVPAGPAPC